MNVYLIVLEGGGDLEIKVVDEETFKWVTSDDMGKADPPKKGDSRYHWEDQLVPKSQIKKMKTEYGAYYEPLTITSGSWDNDRAVAARCADGYSEYMYTIKDTFQTIQQKGDVLVDEYRGYIY